MFSESVPLLCFKQGCHFQQQFKPTVHHEWYKVPSEEEFPNMFLTINTWNIKKSMNMN